MHSCGDANTHGEPTLPQLRDTLHPATHRLWTTMHAIMLMHKVAPTMLSATMTNKLKLSIAMVCCCCGCRCGALRDASVTVYTASPPRLRAGSVESCACELQLFRCWKAPCEAGPLLCKRRQAQVASLAAFV